MANKTVKIPTTLPVGAYDNLLEWPFSYRVTFYLLDQSPDPENRKHIKFGIKPNPCADNTPFLGEFLV